MVRGVEDEQIVEKRVLSQAQLYIFSFDSRFDMIRQLSGHVKGHKALLY